MVPNEKAFRERCDELGWHTSWTDTDQATRNVGVHIDGGWIPLLVDATIDGEFWGKALAKLNRLAERMGLPR